MRLKDAQTMAKASGCSLRHKDGEYRVNLFGSPESHAYYTTSLDDAVNTAKVIGATAPSPLDRAVAARAINPVCR